jgi:hypothetical protein
VKTVKLGKGSHPKPFEGDTPTMCAAEFASYLAGEPHSDQPTCVSPILNRFMVNLNDALDDEKRQKLRPYIVRTLGTAGDGQDEMRSYMALDWLIRVHIPAFLAAAGLVPEADKLRGLAAIEGVGQAHEARPEVNAARDAAWAAARDAAWDATKDAARDALRHTVEMVQVSAFDLLERMLDPGGLHDVPREEELFEMHGRQRLLPA